MKIFLSLVAFFSIPLVSMQAALANVSEKMLFLNQLHLLVKH